jgi:hypothetical protein
MLHTFCSYLRPVYTTKLPERFYYVDEVIHQLSPGQQTLLHQWLLGRTLVVLNDKEVISTSDLGYFLELLPKLEQNAPKTHTR